MPRFREFNVRGVTVFRTLRELTAREKRFLLNEIIQVKGLMPLLMKPRNKQRWTSEDRAQLVIQLRRLSHISPYVVVLVMPGGFFVLPVLAWWLDRRRARIRAGTPSPG